MYGLWGFLAAFTDRGHYNIHFLVVCSVMALGLLPTLILPLFSSELASGQNRTRGAAIAFAARIVASMANFGPYGRWPTVGAAKIWG
ncbi:MAG: hypothetical protein WD468_08515 [Pirellulales bacterium]